MVKRLPLNQGAFNTLIPNTYSIKGTIARAEGVNNPEGIYAHTSVTVITHSFSEKTTSKLALDGVTYKYEDETLVVTATNNATSAGLSKTILDMQTDNLKINLGKTEMILDNATRDALKASGSETTTVSAIQKENVITVKVGSVENVKGIVKAELKDMEEFKDANAYNMVVLKDGKIIPNSYYDEETGKMVFAIDGNGDYTVEKRSSSFADTKGHWAENVISYAAVRGIVSGVGDNDFAPGSIF